MFVSLNFLLFMKTFFLVLQLVNLMIIAQSFLRAWFLLPIWCVQSTSDGWMSSLRCLLIMLIGKVSVSPFRFSSTPCIRTQFCLEYCSCLSPCTERLLTLSVNSETCVWSLNLCQFNCLSDIDGLIFRVQIEHEKPNKCYLELNISLLNQV